MNFGADNLPITISTNIILNLAFSLVIGVLITTIIAAVTFNKKNTQLYEDRYPLVLIEVIPMVFLSVFFVVAAITVAILNLIIDLEKLEGTVSIFISLIRILIFFGLFWGLLYTVIKIIEHVENIIRYKVLIFLETGKPSLIARTLFSFLIISYAFLGFYCFGGWQIFITSSV